MGTSENFCLRWNDFESNVSSSFRDLRNESDFFDVTLACDDETGRTLQAHKVILSACSSFFKRMLRSMANAAPGHPNPLIYLRGVRLVDLESVLDFMYHGEVNVAQDDLNTFLGVAEDLQIKGLTQQSKDMGGGSGRKSRKSNNFSGSGGGSGGPSAKKARKEFNNEDDDEKETVNVKCEPVVAPAAAGFGNEGPSTSRGAAPVAIQSFDDGSGGGDDTYDDGFVGYDDGDTGDGMEGGMDGEDGTKDLDEVLLSYMEKIPNTNQYKCRVCGKCDKRYGLKIHVESNHMQTEGAICEICFFVCKTRNALKIHKWRHHRPNKPKMVEIIKE